MNRLFVLLLAIATLSGCATTRSIGHTTLAIQEAPRDRCVLTVVNHTPFTFKFRVGHLWWEEQNGLLPHQSGRLTIEQDEEHVLARIAWVNGHEFRDEYRFYVPKGTRSHTITFGGLQKGVIHNRTRRAVSVRVPFSDRVLSLSAGASDTVSVMPPKPSFVVYFGDGSYQHTIDWTIDDVHNDQVFNGQPIDWIGTIEPRHEARATKERSF